ncbi:hypothetical protein [Nonomuraea sp. NPDC005650]|uniref:hypothetical protein n=1 Tax=Nonomuraea sp. NPDC005650 TaxID=3157045 RepID=UPI0033A2AD79
MLTEHSDHDLYVILADDTATDLTRFTGHRTPELDLAIITLAEFRAAGMPGFERYALARARVVLDRLDGGIARILAAKARLDADEASRDCGQWLDAYANSLYRSAKNDRDGHLLAARLDAADAVNRISGTGDVPLQRRLFAQVEAAARSAGHGAVLDAWGEDLHLMRPRQGQL